MSVLANRHAASVPPGPSATGPAVAGSGHQPPAVKLTAVAAPDPGNRLPPFEVPVKHLTPDPNQPRRQFDEAGLLALGRNMLRHGQKQPVRVRKADASGVRVIVGGERRYRAALLVGKPSLVALEVDGELTEEELLYDQLSEGLFSERLTVLEQAEAFHKLKRQGRLTNAQLAEELGLSEPHVCKALLVDKRLCEALRAKVADGTLSAEKAYHIAKRAHSPERQMDLYDLVKDMPRERYLPLLTTPRGQKAAEGQKGVSLPGDRYEPALGKEVFLQRRNHVTKVLEKFFREWPNASPDAVADRYREAVQEARKLYPGKPTGGTPPQAA